MNMMMMEPSRAAPPCLHSRKADLLAEAASATTSRLDRLSVLFAAFDRDDMEAGVELLLVELDRLDGDPDVEPNGDELDATSGEDEGTHEGRPFHLAGPGCPISDPDFGADDGEVFGSGDHGWTEWHTRGRHKLTLGGGEIVGRDPAGGLLHEDAEATGDEEDAAWLERPGMGLISAQRCASPHEDGEDDDPAESDGDDADANDAEDDFRLTWQSGRYAADWLPGATGAGCPISDPGELSRQPASTPIAANEVDA